MDRPLPLPYWSMAADQVALSLGSGPAGIAGPEARRRLAAEGTNTVSSVRDDGTLRLLVRQFESPLVLILVFGACVSLVLNQWTDASIILVIILASSILGFLQEYRASRAIRMLRGRLGLTARVVRDGSEQAVPVASIVPGDVVVLSAGNLVPADGLILEATDFLVVESALTGESFPVEKRPGLAPPDASVADRTNCAFMGASVRSGTARLLVVTTGRATVFGNVAARLRSKEPETEFQRGIRRFGGMLASVMLVVVLLVLTANHLLGRPFSDSLLFAVALAVGLSPELLPAIMTVTLASGARRMAASGVLVRRLEAIENLGSIDVLCTDKTGTLTKGRVILEACTDPEGRASAQVEQWAFLNAHFETGIANPLDEAVMVRGKAAALSAAGYVKLDEIPYDFTRRRLTIVAASNDERRPPLMITKGAVASILECCTMIDTADGPRPLVPDDRHRLSAHFESWGRAGYRVLALATREMADRRDYVRADETEMTFRGFLRFVDPPREDAASTLKDLAGLGIRVKVISGDNRHVTAHIAEAVGLSRNALLTGEQIAAMRDEALWQAAPHTDLFAEIDPQQKERIVRALQRAGHAVGYLGDGINDAPALHAADIGISVDQAVDVAREGADVVLMRPDLGVLREGVELGRHAFVNTNKYIAITASANFGNMISMALASPLLPFLPLLPKQILLNNFLSDIPGFALAADNVDPESVSTPQRWSIQRIRHFMIVFGALSSVFDLLTFAALLAVFHAGPSEFHTAWFVVSLLTELLVVFVLRTSRPAWRSRPGRVLLIASLLVAGVCLLLPYLGPLAAVFGFVPLPPVLLGGAAVIVVAYVCATEFAKLVIIAGRAKSAQR